jgi:hypothetical protein
MNPFVQRILAITGCALIGCLVQFVVFGLSAAMVGAGHGTGAFLDALAGPFPGLQMVFWLWPVVGALFAMSDKAWGRGLLSGLLGFHYLGVLMAIMGGRFDFRDSRVWSGPGIILVVIYLAVQVVVWTGIVASARSRRKSRP